MVAFMTASIPSLAAAAVSAPETSFQALGREAGPAMAARIAVATPLAPIIEQVGALLLAVPDGDRLHACRDRSWSSIWLSHPPRSGADRGQPTPLLARLPGLLALLDELGGRVGLAVIARIAPGDLLDWHYDPASLDHPWARLHLPVRTHPQAVTDLCHERVHWPAGGLYYGDYGFPHRVLNPGAEERIHLYFDMSADAVAARLPAALRDGGDRRRLRETAVNLMLAERAAGLG